MLCKGRVFVDSEDKAGGELGEGEREVVDSQNNEGDNKGGGYGKIRGSFSSRWRSLDWPGQRSKLLASPRTL